MLGLKQVITAEGDFKTEFAENLTADERILIIREKLQSPIEWAKELGIELLLEPHGIVTDNIESMKSLLDALGNEDVIGVNLDTGNSWLGGGEPLGLQARVLPDVVVPRQADRCPRPQPGTQPVPLANQAYQQNRDVQAGELVREGMDRQVVAHAQPVDGHRRRSDGQDGDVDFLPPRPARQQDED